jgi:ABC-type bacteriocin/lantibiotic exporter with double-glycine peptidase domain
MKIQPDSFSCGVYAVMNAARALGVVLKRKEIVKHSKTSKQGTTEKGVIRALKKHKFKVDTFSLPYIRAMPMLMDCINKNKPVIIYLSKEEHWCTVIGMIGDNFILFDSDNEIHNVKENGVQILSAEELAERWEDRTYYYGITVSI